MGYDRHLFSPPGMQEHDAIVNKRSLSLNVHTPKGGPLGKVVISGAHGWTAQVLLRRSGMRMLTLQGRSEWLERTYQRRKNLRTARSA